jgi:hypothetical protein
MHLLLLDGISCLMDDGSTFPYSLSSSLFSSLVTSTLTPLPDAKVLLLLLPSPLGPSLSYLPQRRGALPSPLPHPSLGSSTSTRTPTMLLRHIVPTVTRTPSHIHIIMYRLYRSHYSYPSRLSCISWYRSTLSTLAFAMLSQLHCYLIRKDIPYIGPMVSKIANTKGKRK